MSRSGVLACVAALCAGLFTAGIASGSQSPRLLGVTIPPVLPGLTLPGVTVPPITLPGGTTTPAVTTPSVTTPPATVPTVTDPSDVVSTITDALTPPSTTTTTPTVTPPAPGETGGTIAGAVQGVVAAVAAATGSGGGTQGGQVAPAALSTLLTSVFGAASIDPADKAAPKVTFKVVTRLRQAARTGRLKVRVVASEPAVVALSSALRAGRARRSHGKPLKVSRELLKTKATVLAFRSAGPVTATIKLPAKTRKSLANAQSARIALQAWASDISRNQTTYAAKRTVRR